MITLIVGWRWGGLKSKTERKKNPSPNFFSHHIKKFLSLPPKITFSDPLWWRWGGVKSRGEGRYCGSFACLPLQVGWGMFFFYTSDNATRPTKVKEWPEVWPPLVQVCCKLGGSLQGAKFSGDKLRVWGGGGVCFSFPSFFWAREILALGNFFLEQINMQ